MTQALTKRGADMPLIARAAQESAALMEEAAVKISELAASTSELASKVNDLTNEHASTVTQINSAHENLTGSLTAQG
eukprot:2294227-Prymnesium_polylepis.1